MTQQWSLAKKDKKSERYDKHSNPVHHINPVLGTKDCYDVVCLSYLFDFLSFLNSDHWLCHLYIAKLKSFCLILIVDGPRLILVETKIIK